MLIETVLSGDPVYMEFSIAVHELRSEKRFIIGSGTYVVVGDISHSVLKTSRNKKGLAFVGMLFF